jgi:hypothetical protein
MSRNRDEDDALLRFDVEDTTNNNEEGSKTEASVTPPTTTTRLGGVTTLQDNNKTKAIENMGINLKDQSKRNQLPTFNLNQTRITKL